MKDTIVIVGVLLILSTLMFMIQDAKSYEVGSAGPEGGTITDIATTEEVTSVEYVLRADGFEEEITTTLITTTITEDVQSSTSSTISSTTTETITSTNYVDDSNTTTSSTNISIPGSTYGLNGADFSTGGQQLSGGSLTYNFPVDTTNTIDMILYGATVHSHSSNTSVPYCANTTGDCKDQFKITVRLYDNGSLVNTYTHNYTDINWAGSKNYSYTQNVSDYFFNTASMELYGMDAGYYSGYYGPGFSDSFFQTQYDQTISIIQTIESIVTNSVETVLTEYQQSTIETYLGNPATDIQTQSYNTFTSEPMAIEIQIDSPTATVSDFSMDLGPIEFDMDVDEPIGNIALVEIDTDMEEMPALDMQSAPVAMDVESDVELDIEVDVEVEAEAETSAPTSNRTAQKSNSKSKSKTSDSKSESKVTMKSIIASQAAEQAVSDVVSRLTQDNQMRVIATLGANLKDVLDLKDANFYVGEDIYINKTMVDPYGKAFSRAQDTLMDKMVEEQYER